MYGQHLQSLKYPLEIDDLTNTGNNKVINGVPWAVGYPMSLISALDYKLDKHMRVHLQYLQLLDIQMVG